MKTDVPSPSWGQEFAARGRRLARLPETQLPRVKSRSGRAAPPHGAAGRVSF